MSVRYEHHSSFIKEKGNITHSLDLINDMRENMRKIAFSILGKKLEKLLFLFIHLVGNGVEI